jgi:hypothetical protein
LGQLFCRECGKKLDLSKLKPPGQERGAGLRLGAGRLLRLAVTLALLTVLGLLCWPATPAGDASSPGGAAMMQGRLTAIRGAALRNLDARDVFPEADLNAHLNAVMTGRESSGGALNLTLREVRLDLRAGGVEVWTASSLGPLTITYRTDVAVDREPGGGRFLLEPAGASIGRLPLPGPLQERVHRQLAGLFGALTEERALLSRLPEVTLAEGILSVSTQPR